MAVPDSICSPASVAVSQDSNMYVWVQDLGSKLLALFANCTRKLIRSLFLIPFHFLLLSSFAFNPSTTRYELSVSASTLAHQLAHNIGIKHDESGKFLYSLLLLGKYPAS